MTDLQAFSIRADVRDPGDPSQYRDDAGDEMTAGALIVLAAARKRIVAHLSWNPDAAFRAVDVLDEYAAEILHDSSGWEDDEPPPGANL